MTVRWRYLLLFQVLFLKSLRISTTFIYQTIEGNLNDLWQINFALFVKKFKGEILSVNDTHFNTFGIQIKQEDEAFIHLNYNKVWLELPTLKTCQCNPCENRKMEFVIKFKKTIINISCNRNVFYTLKAQGVSYTLNKNNTLNIRLGSILQSVKIRPRKEEMTGCLMEFVYNNKSINFHGKENFLKTSCFKRCLNNTCNKGLCQKNVSESSLCDCSLTHLVGPYCNTSLKLYFSKQNNSFRPGKGFSHLNLKLSWYQKLNPLSCLMEIVGKPKNYTIWINATNFLLNTMVIGSNIKEEKFVNIYVSYNDLIIKNKEIQRQINISLNEIIKVNVGFQESIGLCKIFDGMYDLNYVQSQLKLTERPYLIQRNLYAVITIISSIGGFLIIVLIICGTYVTIKLITKTNGTVQIISQSQNVLPLRDLRIERDSSTSDSYHRYSTVDYSKMYLTNSVGQDSNGYILPSQQELEDIGPSLPPRNSD